MGQFTVMDITNLESAGSRESLGSRIGLMIMNSATVNARVEEITFDTGEYAVVLRGVLQPQAKALVPSHDADETTPIVLDADETVDQPAKTSADSLS